MYAVITPAAAVATSAVVVAAAVAATTTAAMTTAAAGGGTIGNTWPRYVFQSVSAKTSDHVILAQTHPV